MIEIFTGQADAAAKPVLFQKLRAVAAGRKVD